MNFEEDLSDEERFRVDLRAKLKDKDTPKTQQIVRRRRRTSSAGAEERKLSDASQLDHLRKRFNEKSPLEDKPKIE